MGASLEAAFQTLRNGLISPRLKSMVNILLTSKRSGVRLQPTTLGNPTPRFSFLDLKASSAALLPKSSF